MLSDRITMEVALRIRADLEQARAALDRTDDSIDNVGASAKRANVELSKVGSGREFDRLAQDAVKSRIELQRVGATSQQVTQTLARNASQTAQLGVSARQTAQAMRQLPMQITDVFTGLASGQNPMLVLIQQGGQLKDSFGGVVPAARALLGAINPLSAGIAIATGAIGAYLVALKQGEDRLAGFERAIVLTGNSALTTAEHLSEMASRLDSSTDATAGRASEAIAQVASTGQFTEEQIEAVATAAIRMQDATGAAIDQTVQEFVRLAKDPVDAILALNDSQHFLTQDTLQQIRTFQEQGKQADAAALAIRTYADTINDRAPRVAESLGTIDTTLRSIKNAAAEAWDEIVQGVDDSARSLSQASTRIGEVFRALRGNGPGAAFAMQAALTPREVRPSQTPNLVNTQQEKQRQEQEKANKAALDTYQRITERYLPEQLRMEKEIREMRAAGQKAGQSEVEMAKQEAAIRKTFAERGSKRRQGASDAERDAKAAEQYVKQLERQAATIGLTKEKTTEYEIAERKLSGALKERAEAAARTIGKAEEQQRAKEDAKLVAQAQTEYLRAIGNDAASSGSELQQRYGELLQRLIKRGDEAGTEIVRKLFDAGKARTSLTEMQTELDRFLQQQSQAEERVNIDRQNGLISGIEAQQKLLELRRQEIARLQETIPLLQQQATILQDPQQLAALDNLKLRLYQLQQQAGEIQTAFQNGLQNGLGDALSNLADETQTIGDRVRGIIDGVANSLGQLAAQQLASLATSKLLTALGKGKDGKSPDIGAPNPAQAAAAGTAYAAPIGAAALALSGSAGPLAAAAAALSAAAGQLAAAGAANGGGSGGGGGDAGAGGAGSWASWFQLASSLFGFAEGGPIQGRGTSTSDSNIIRASNGEYMIKAAAVRHYGVGVMDAINSMSLPSMQAMTPRISHQPKHRFADGGLVRGDVSGTPSVNFRNINLFDINDLAQAVFNHPGFERASLNVISTNPSKITRQLNR